jgi:hypothetical protein
VRMTADGASGNSSEAANGDCKILANNKIQRRPRPLLNTHMDMFKPSSE